MYLLPECENMLKGSSKDYTDCNGIYYSSNNYSNASYALTLKEAFIDSYIMCQMLTVFLQVAPQTELSVDLYGKLCGLSSKFKEMWQNAGFQNQNVA